MTRDFENMLYLFGCGARGSEPLSDNCVNIKKIRELSIAQNVWPIVYSAIRKKLESGETSIGAEIYKNLEFSFEANLAKTIQKNEFNKNVILKLEKEGVKVCLFKGMALAQLYAIPETRVSGDVDILIDIKDEEKVSGILKNLGYNVQKRDKNDHHVAVTHPIGGVMEVHVSMMRENWDDNMFFNKIKYRGNYVKTDEGIRILGVDDGLINTATHFIKHFVGKGAGVRHIMDLLLYLEKYEKEIDFTAFDSVMEELRYKKLIDTVKTAGEKFWGFAFSDYERVDDETVDAFLTDMEKGGAFGFGEEGRNETYSQFIKRRKNLTEREFKRFSMTGMDRTLFEKIFPSRAYMIRNYHLEKSHGIYLLVAHIRRWISIITNVLSGKKSYSIYMYEEEKETSQQVLERIELFEKLNIID